MVFITISISCRDWARQWLWGHHLILAEIFLIWQKPQHVWGCLNLFKSFAAWSFFLWYKLVFSHFVWEIPNVFMHYLPDKKPWLSYVPRYGADWLLESLSIMAWLSPTNSDIFLSEQLIRHPSCCTFYHWTLSTLFESSSQSSDWLSNTEIFVLKHLA